MNMIDSSNIESFIAFKGKPREMTVQKGQVIRIDSPNRDVQFLTVEEFGLTKKENHVEVTIYSKAVEPMVGLIREVTFYGKLEDFIFYHYK